MNAQLAPTESSATEPAAAATLVSPPPPPKQALTESEITKLRSDAQVAKQRRRESMAKWVPNQSTPYVEVVLKLNSAPAQRVFHLSLPHAQRSLYMLYHTLQAVGPKSEEALSNAEDVIKNELKRIQTALEKDQKRCDDILNSIAGERHSGYTQPLNQPVLMFTPEAAQFGKTLESFDRLVGTVESLWLAAALDRKQRAAAIGEHRNALAKFARRIHSLLLDARRLARNEGRQREVARFNRLYRKSHSAQTHGLDFDALPADELAGDGLGIEGQGDLAGDEVISETPHAEDGKGSAKRTRSTRTKAAAA